MATLALVFGILSFVCLGPVGGVLAVVFGIVGLSRSRQMNGRGRGMSIAGIVLAIVNLLVTIAVVILVIVLAGVASDSVSNRIGGPASPSTYEIKIQTCAVDDLGSARFTGVITNTTSSSKNFLVSTEVTDSFGTDLGSVPLPVIAISPGGSRTWQAITMTAPVGSITCRVTGVDDLFN